MVIDATHDPSLRSWLPSANASGTDFPIQNLPLGVFRRRGSSEQPRVGVAIGDQVLDVSIAVGHGLLSGDALPPARACEADSLNELMSMGPDAARALRHAMSELLRVGGPGAVHAGELLIPMAQCELVLPARVGDYTDFYASLAHASNVGSMMRPENPLLPNYKHLPIGYHGRASSLVVSDTDVQRPCGQTREVADQPPRFGATARLDYELEVGAFIGAGNERGIAIPIREAEAHVFGLCLVNDWTARDIQAWEYQPLGPFLSKSFATTVSPWVVTLDALAPFRTKGAERSSEDPDLLPYLAPANALSAFQITLEVSLRSSRMRDRGDQPFLVSHVSFAEMFWSIGQLVAHHTSNGCNLRPGDLLASGTVSGRTPDSTGCLLERTWRGRHPLILPTGETRTFLEDGDEVTMRGFCDGVGRVRIGFGECRGVVLPARVA